MTKIDILKFGEDYLIILCGHSDNDRVCAGISTLTAALEGWLLNSGTDYTYLEGNGAAFIRCSKKCETAVEVFLNGALRLQETAPENIEVGMNFSI